jgi:hypothetical protein
MAAQQRWSTEIPQEQESWRCDSVDRLTNPPFLSSIVVALSFVRSARKSFAKAFLRDVPLSICSFFAFPLPSLSTTKSSGEKSRMDGNMPADFYLKPPVIEGKSQYWSGAQSNAASSLLSKNQRADAGGETRQKTDVAVEAVQRIPLICRSNALDSTTDRRHK